MSKVKPQFECKWCRRLERRDVLVRDHGRFAPRCVYFRTWDWLNDNDYATPGRDETVLRLAGLIKMVRVQAWYATVDLVPSETGSHRQKWTHHDLVAFVPSAPRWALKMARQLVDDQPMIQRLKIGRKQKRSGTRGARFRQSEGLDPGYILMIPIEVRAQILQAAASNTFVHAMVTDEDGGLETAIIIARDMKMKQVS